MASRRERTSMADPYKTLGITATATQDEIKQAYRKKVRELHPDQNPDNPDAERLMKEVNAAYEALKSETKRAEFDASKFNSYRSIFEDAFFQHCYDDIGSRFSQRRPMQNNVQATIGVPLHAMVSGGRVTTGIVVPTQSFFRQQHVTVSCDIPPDCPVGYKVVLTKSHHGVDGINTVILDIRPAGSSEYEVRGLDIIVPISVDVFDAILGRVVEIDLPTGRRVRITVPTDASKAVRLINQGLSDLSGKRGNILLDVAFSIPELSSEKIDQIRDIIEP